MEEARLIELLDNFGKAQGAIIARLEAKVEQQEQLLATLVSGYLDIAAMVQALVDERINDLEFQEAVGNNRAAMMQALQYGTVNAQDQSNQFSSVNYDAKTE